MTALDLAAADCRAPHADDDHEILDRLRRRLHHRPVRADYPLHGICAGCACPVTQPARGEAWAHDGQPVIRRLPGLYMKQVNWPWPGMASPSDEAIVEAAWEDHYRSCSLCNHPRRPGRRLGPREYDGWCLWGRQLGETTRRVATRGEGGDVLVPATLWRH